MAKIDANTLFHFYLKNLNNFYNLPIDIQLKFKDTINLANKFDNSVYNNLVSTFSQYLVPDFEYLFTAGLYFSLLANGSPFAIEKCLEKLYKLMSSKNDPLRDYIFDKSGKIKANELVNDYLSPLPVKVFEFLGNNFTGQAAWVAKAEQLPESKTMINLFVKSKILSSVLEKYGYIDVFIKQELEKFLEEFTKDFSNMPEIKELVDNFVQDPNLVNDLQAWKIFLNTISGTLATINEFIKPLTINSEKELNAILNLINLLNLSQKDPNQFYFVVSNLNTIPLGDSIRNLIDDLFMMGVNNIDKGSLIKELSTSLYSTLVGITSSFLKKSIRQGDLKYGDCLYFLKLFSLASILLDLINSEKFNTFEYNNAKQQLKNLLMLKKFGNDLVNLLDSFDKNVVISVLEIIKRMGQKVTPWVIQKSPDMPKDRTFWLRLNLWSKIYNSLDKQNPNYAKYRQFMIMKLRSIIASYGDTTQFSMFINNLIMNENIFDSFVKNLDSLLNTIAGFPVAYQYDDPDYLFSQLLRLNFLKSNSLNDNVNQLTNQVMKTSIQTELISKIMTKDNVLNKLVLDYNDYKMNLKENKEDIFYKVLESFYGASVYSL